MCTIHLFIKPRSGTTAAAGPVWRHSRVGCITVEQNSLCVFDCGWLGEWKFEIMFLVNSC